MIEQGQEVAYGRDKGVGIVDFNRINAAGVPIDEIVPWKRQLPVARLPARGAVRVAGKNPALIKELIRRAAKKASHASHAVRHIDRGGVGDGVARIGRGARVAGVLHQHIGGTHIGAVVPDVRDEGGSQGAGKIHPHAARGIIGRIQSHADRGDGRLARRRVGRFARGHGHDLLAHDHEAVIEDGHQHDQEDGQDERELDEGLALAPAPAGPELLEVRKGLHGGVHGSPG